MSLAIDRQSIIDNIAQADQLPTTGLHAEGHARLRRAQPGVAVAAADGRHGAGEEADGRGREPEEEHHPLHQRLPGPQGHRGGDPGCLEGARDHEHDQAAGVPAVPGVPRPAPNADVDVYRLGWIGDFVDAINFLDLWTCKSGNNNTNWCNKDYDAVIEKAKNTADTDARYKLYGEAEDILGGENGEMPVMPIYWYTFTNLERESVKDYVQRQPAQPDRPDQGRRHRIALSARTGTGPKRLRPRSATMRTG